ncbi:MAG: hypothetical protein M3178_10600 [Pseudomonadota bacterium]|nr:hypothetical protein [Pseudomonadota bacterium]
MNNSAKLELLKRFSSAPHVDGLRTVLNSAFLLGEQVGTAKTRAANDPHLSDAGRKAEVAKFAIDTVKPLIEVTAPMRKAIRWNQDRRESLKLPEHSRDDLVGELRRQELRAFARSLKMVERLPFALEHPDAILDAPAALSGLPDDQYSRVRENYVAAKFGPEIAEIETLDEDLSTVRAAHDLALSELRANAGIGEHAFQKLVDTTTREIDGA